MSVNTSSEPPDRDAFVEFVTPHLVQMAVVASRLGSRDERDDILQEALLRAWRGWPGYDPGKGSATAWLCTIAANVARSRARKFRFPFAVAPAAPVLDLDRSLDVSAAISRLPRRQREAVTVYYGLGLSTDETAAVMSCSPGTVKSTLAAARRRLNELLRVSEDREATDGRS